jgi:hypothetical protein
MHLADSAESGDCQTNREIAKYLFVSSHTVSACLRHSFDDMRVKSGVTLTSLAADRRLDIARTGDAWRHGTCHRCQEKCRSLRWCLADKTVARS